MPNYIFVHGRNQALSKAELEALYHPEGGDGHSRLQGEIEHHVGWSLVRVETSLDQAFQNRLGGTVKICQVFEEDPSALIEQCAKSDKIVFGLSQYGCQGQLSKTLLALKKELRARGRNARFINKNFTDISSGQLNQTRLLEKGIDLIRCCSPEREYWARTVTFQDIDANSKRDYEKPFRDMKVGMLPPKLAQIMINLAQPGEGTVIYDPFCGLGTIPMEALLRGNPGLASDLKGGMVHATEKNLEWLRKQDFCINACGPGGFPTSSLFQHDATQPFPKNKLSDDLVVVTEGYLGPPLSRFPEASLQKEIFDSLHRINSSFFSHASKILKSGKRMAFCFPFFRGRGSKIFYPEPWIQEYARDNGFELRLSLRSLLYEREQQVVGREIVVFRKQ